MNTRNPDYRGYRFPPEIIAHAVWLYHRFCLSFREVEELLAERGVTVGYEAVRQWCLRFGQAFAKRLRCRQGRLGDTWHLDEVFVTRGIERVFGVARQTLAAWLKKAAPRALVQDTLLPARARDTLEVDEGWSFVGTRQKKRWLWTALCRHP
jgi:transposase-like protein